MALTDVMIIPAGVPTKVVSLATTTGTTFSQLFTLSAWAGGRSFGQVTIQFVIASGTFSAFIVDLEISLDAGTTWTKVDTFDLVAISAQRTNLNGGALYRFNVTTFTGGSTPKADLYIVI